MAWTTYRDFKLGEKRERQQSAKPPTEAQLALLRSWGVTETPKDQWQAAKLLETLAKVKRPGRWQPSRFRL